jgi:hypothetical protein
MSWDEHEALRQRSPVGRLGASAEEPAFKDRFAELALGTFTSGSGRTLLAMLREMYIDRRINPAAASHAGLIAAEAERQFVLRLEDAVKRGSALASAKKSEETNT